MGTSQKRAPGAGQQSRSAARSGQRDQQTQTSNAAQTTYFATQSVLASADGESTAQLMAPLADAVTQTAAAVTVVHADAATPEQVDIVPEQGQQDTIGKMAQR